MFTPDGSYKCVNCGKVLRESLDHNQFQERIYKKKSTNKTAILLVFIVVALAILGYLIIQKETGSMEPSMPSSFQPGQEIDIETLVVSGKTTIFDFYSDYCPPCRKISPLLKKLDEKRDDIVVIKLDINRPGIKGVIDWKSPLARQYKLHGIPHFIIYDTSGNRTHEGRLASDRVFQLLYQEKVN
jgi:thiol-disulfide isomerase/thioredoxin